MNYIIYRLPSSHPAKFMNTEFAIKHCDGIPERNEYVMVYVGQMYRSGVKSDIELLSHIYEKLNVDHPADYHIPSLSVSDVIGLEVGNKQWEWWYVDSIGFKRIWGDNA